MKKIMFSAGMMIMSVSVNITNAQDVKTIPTPTAAGAAAADLGSALQSPASGLITQLIGGLSPSAFKPNFTGEKAGFLKTVGAVSNLASASGVLSKLIGFIKPAMFSKGVNPAQLIKTVSAAKNMAGLGSVMSSLAGGLKPAAFSADWGKSKEEWLKSISGLQ